MDNSNEPKADLGFWRKFMNGYRDPVTTEAERREIWERAKRVRDTFGDPKDFGYGGGGFSSGGDSPRECGDRKEGGTYAVVPTGANGRPVEYFLACPPVPINREEYGLANVGVKLVDIEEVCLACNGSGKLRATCCCRNCSGTGKETVTHVFDIIGQEYYPNVADFLEEVRRLGVSRRLELEDSKQYARLSSRSRLFFLHGKAVFKNAGEILGSMQTRELQRLARANCPKSLPLHNTELDQTLTSFGLNVAEIDKRGCSALFWNVVESGETVPEFSREEDALNFDGCEMCNGNGTHSDGDPNGFPTPCATCDGEGKTPRVSNFVERKLVSGTYRAYRTDALPEYELGIFAVFPLARIEVVDPEGTYGDRVERASAAGVDVYATDC